MTQSSTSQQHKPPERPSPSGLIVWLCVLTVVGLTIADFANDGTVAFHWPAALIVLAFGFAGKLGESFFKALAEWITRR